MKYTLTLCALFIYALLTAQNITTFEVNTQPAYAEMPAAYLFDHDSALIWQASLPDTAAHKTTFILAIEEPATISNLQLTLTNSGGTAVYNTSQALSTWQSNNASRLQDNVLYLTIEAGPYAALKRCEASATITYPGGDATKTFTKN